MKVLLFILLFPQIILAQENYFYTHDLNSRSQIYLDHLADRSNLYAFGATICATGECGVLTGYDENGELLFLIEIDNIDATSFKCLTIKQDTILLVALSKYELGARLQKYNLEGGILEDIRVMRDSSLVYTWPLDVLYRDEFIYLAVDENYENEPRQTAVYKLDYQGNVLDFIRLPYQYRGSILTLTQLENGNLFVTQPYLDDGLCAFAHGDPSRPNAVIFYEISSDSFNILRKKQNICYQYTNSVSYGSRVLVNGNIIRNIIWRDPNNEDIRNTANIYYNSEWEYVGIDNYPLLQDGNPLASHGIIGNRSYASLDSNFFYIGAFDRYPVAGEDFPYVNFLIQKWDIDRNLIWERVISDLKVHHRIYFNSLVETESGITLAGYVWRDFDVGGTQDFAIMSLDLDGCFNGDCSDTIYLNGPPTSTFDFDKASDITIYPNPFSDQITIASSEQLRQVICYGLDGTLILEEEVVGREHKVDLGAFAAGMYIIKVVTDGGMSTRKVMKL